eukprot:gene3176-2158_t
MSTNTYKLQKDSIRNTKNTSCNNCQLQKARTMHPSNLQKPPTKNSHISNPTKQQLIQPINGHPETHLRIVQIKFKTIYEVHKAYNNTKIPKLIPITFFQTKAQIALVNTTSNTTTPKSPTRSNVHTHKHYKKLKSKSINTHPKLQQTKAKKLSTCIVKAHCTHQVTSLSNAYKRRNNMNYTTNQICKSSGTIIHKLLKLLCNPHASSTKRQQYYIYLNPFKLMHAETTPITHAKNLHKSTHQHTQMFNYLSVHQLATPSQQYSTQNYNNNKLKTNKIISIIYYFPVSQRYILHNIKKSQTNRVTNYNPNNSPDHNNPAKPTYTRTKATTRKGNTIPNSQLTRATYQVQINLSVSCTHNKLTTNTEKPHLNQYCTQNLLSNATKLLQHINLTHHPNPQSNNQFQTKPCIRATLKQYRLYKPTRQNSSNNKPQYGNSSTSFTASNVLTTNTTTLIGSTRKLTHYKLKLKHDKAMSQWHTY